MKKFIVVAFMMTLIFTLLSACGTPKYAAVPINEDTDKCAICNMQVKDDAFAVQLTTKDGKTYKFDDIGCMNEWTGKNGLEQVGAQFVRDYNSKEWIPYETATYVFDSSFKTPMAYGIYSFKSKQDAQKFTDEQKKGKLMMAAELKNHTWERTKGMMDMGGNHADQAHSEMNHSMQMGGDDKGMHAK